MKDMDAVPSNVQSARQGALLYVFEDNEIVINMFPEPAELFLIGCSIESI